MQTHGSRSGGRSQSASSRGSLFTVHVEAVGGSSSLVPCLSFQRDSGLQVPTSPPNPTVPQTLDRAGHAPRLSHLESSEYSPRSPGPAILRTALREPARACPCGATAEVDAFAPGGPTPWTPATGRQVTFGSNGSHG